MDMFAEIKMEYQKWKNSGKSEEYLKDRKERKIHRNPDFSYDKLISLLLDKKITEKSASLTYYTLTSLPAFAFILRILGAFHLESPLANIANKIVPIVDVNQAISTADNYFAEENAFVIISIIFALYGCWSLKNNIKSIGNDIWTTRSKNEKIRDAKNNDDTAIQLIKKELKSLAINLGTIIFGCFLIGAFSLLIISAFSLLFAKLVSSTLISQWYFSIIGVFLPLMLYVIGIKIILGEKVDFKCSFFGAKKGFIVILLFNLVMFLFQEQILTSYNRYGIYAPIFIALLWLYVFWISFLVGFASTCAKKKSYILYMQKESNNVSDIYRIYLTIKVASFIKKVHVENINKKDESPNLIENTNLQDRYIKDLQIPISLSKRIIGDLMDVKFISNDNKHGWVIKKDINTVGELVKKLLQKGDYDLNRDYISDDEMFWHEFTNNMLYWEKSFTDKPLVDIITKTTELGDLKSNEYSINVINKMNKTLDVFYSEKTKEDSCINNSTNESEEYSDSFEENSGLLTNITSIIGIIADKIKNRK